MRKTRKTSQDYFIFYHNNREVEVWIYGELPDIGTNSKEWWTVEDAVYTDTNEAIQPETIAWKEVEEAYKQALEDRRNTNFFEQLDYG